MAERGRASRSAERRMRLGGARGIALQAGWWLRDYAFAARRQLAAVRDRTAPDSFTRGHHTPIVVLPGVYETWRFLMPLVRALHERGHPVHVIEELGWNRRSVVETAEQVAGFLQQRDLRGAVVLAHSKGGLVGKHVTAAELASAAAGALPRVAAMVAVATPFGGSSYARLVPGQVIRSFRTNDATIVALAAELGVDAHIVSVFGRFDPHLPEGSRLAGARNVELATGGHFRVLAHPRILAEVEALAP